MMSIIDNSMPVIRNTFRYKMNLNHFSQSSVSRFLLPWLQVLFPSRSKLDNATSIVIELFTCPESITSPHSLIETTLIA